MLYPAVGQHIGSLESIKKFSYFVKMIFNCNVMKFSTLKKKKTSMQLTCLDSFITIKYYHCVATAWP